VLVLRSSTSSLNLSPRTLRLLDFIVTAFFHMLFLVGPFTSTLYAGAHYSFPVLNGGFGKREGFDCGEVKVSFFFLVTSFTVCSFCVLLRSLCSTQVYKDFLLEILCRSFLFVLHIR
jgi:hypothetical protein